MYTIFNQESEPQVLESREDFKQAKLLADAMSRYYPLDSEVLVLDPYGKDVYSTNIGALFRYKKA